MDSQQEFVIVTDESGRMVFNDSADIESNQDNQPIVNIRSSKKKSEKYLIPQFMNNTNSQPHSAYDLGTGSQMNIKNKKSDVLQSVPVQLRKHIKLLKSSMLHRVTKDPQFKNQSVNSS